jgi:hypothetical protein
MMDLIGAKHLYLLRKETSHVRLNEGIKATPRTSLLAFTFFKTGINLIFFLFYHFFFFFCFITYVFIGFDHSVSSGIESLNCVFVPSYRQFSHESQTYLYGTHGNNRCNKNPLSEQIATT